MLRSESIELVIGISSCHATRPRAEAVRRTWLAGPLPPGVRCYFVVGHPGLAQPRLEGDHLWVDCGDDYEDLPEKVCAFLTFAAEHHPSAVTFKCDDDTYVRLPELAALARGLDAGYAGHVRRLSSPEGEQRARSWHIDKVRDPQLAHPYEGPLERPWCDGGAGYFLAPEARRALLAGWRRPAGYMAEDVHVAELLAGVGIEPRHLPGFHRTAGRGPTQGGGGEVTVHPVASEEMDRLHATWLTPGGAACPRS